MLFDVSELPRGHAVYLIVKYNSDRQFLFNLIFSPFSLIHTL